MSSISDRKKTRGRPAIGIGTPVVVRLHPPALARLDAWITQQPDQPTRPEAMRRLIDAGLKIEVHEEEA